MLHFVTKSQILSNEKLYINIQGKLREKMTYYDYNYLNMMPYYSSTPGWNLNYVGDWFSNPSNSYNYNPNFNSAFTVNSNSAQTSNQSAKETYEQRIARLQREVLYGAEDGSSVKISNSDRRRMKDTQKEVSANATQEAQGSAGGACLGMLPFAAPAIYSGCKASKKPDVINMFLELDANGAAKYAKFYEEAPETMQQAQKVMQKVHNKYLSDLKSAVGDDVLTNQIKNDYAGLEKMMKDALKSDQVDNVAKATARLEGSFGSTLRTRFVSQAGKRTAMARAVDTSAVTAVKGTKLNIFGGKTGLAIGVLMTMGTYFLTEKGKVEEAKSISEETAKKQRRQSMFRLFGSFTAYAAGEGLGKMFVSKYLSKSVGKWAARVASKGFGKLFGTAVGSIIPGAGTILGLFIGTAFDLLVSKVVIPAIFGKDDAVNVATIDKKTDEELVTDACIKELNGEQLTMVEKRSMQYNPAFCAKVKEQIQQELLLQQQQAMQAQNQGVPV